MQEVNHSALQGNKDAQKYGFGLGNVQKYSINNEFITQLLRPWFD